MICPKSYTWVWTFFSYSEEIILSQNTQQNAAFNFEKRPNQNHTSVNKFNFFRLTSVVRIRHILKKKVNIENMSYKKWKKKCFTSWIWSFSHRTVDNCITHNKGCQQIYLAKAKFLPLTFFIDRGIKANTDKFNRKQHWGIFLKKIVIISGVLKAEL